MKELKFDNDLCDDILTSYDVNSKFNEITTKLSKKRATNYNDWVYIGFALIMLFNRKIITRGQLLDVFDLFSAKADIYDADSIVINVKGFDGKVYGMKYLLDCLKIDNEEYYRQITKKDMIIDGPNDDIGANEIVVNYNEQYLMICKGL